MSAPLELPEAGCLLHERAPILGLRRQHLLDLALADDRVHRRAEPDVREDLHEIGPAHRGAVDEVLPLGSADEPAGDRDLRELEIRPGAVLVVEHELDLAVLAGPAIATSREQDVVRLLGAKLRGRQRACSPDDRVGDVRLARAVRPDDDGNARLEVDLERVRKRLEAADAERAQVHRAPFWRPIRTAPRWAEPDRRSKVGDGGPRCGASVAACGERASSAKVKWTTHRYSSSRRTNRRAESRVRPASARRCPRSRRCSSESPAWQRASPGSTASSWARAYSPTSRSARCSPPVRPTSRDRS